MGLALYLCEYYILANYYYYYYKLRTNKLRDNLF